MGKVVFFVSGNVHKFNEARFVLSGFGVSVALLKFKRLEIQDDSVECVAVVSILDAVRRFGLPLVVEDAGLFVNALAGFPGVFSSYVFKTLGVNGLLKLMKDVDDRSAFFHSVVAFCAPKGKPVVFHGRVDGRIIDEVRGGAGFGFDPVFAPLNGDGRTFAEMSMMEKSCFSHRAEAFRRFGEWYTSR